VCAQEDTNKLYVTYLLSHWGAHFRGICNDSLQKVASSLGKHLVVVALERQPSFLRRSNLFVCLDCLTIRYDLWLVSASSCRCVYEELCLTGFIEGEEPECCFVDGLAYGEYAVVLEDGCFSVAYDGV
jgi:hypothetical protein